MKSLLWLSLTSTDNLVSASILFELVLKFYRYLTIKILKNFQCIFDVFFQQKNSPGSRREIEYGSRWMRIHSPGCIRWTLGDSLDVFQCVTKQQWDDAFIGWLLAHDAVYLHSVAHRDTQSGYTSLYCIADFCCWIESTFCLSFF